MKLTLYWNRPPFFTSHTLFSSTMRIQAHHYNRRQDDSLTVPTAAGLTAAQTASANAVVNSALLVDGDASGNSASVTADLVVGSTAVVVTSTPSSSAISHSNASQAAASASAKGGLATGAMIGIIVAVFAGVLLLILIVYFSLRKRWASALDKAQRERAQQPWAKLDDSNNNGEDKWEGMEKSKEMSQVTTARSNTTKSVDTSARLSLFRKASSTRSGIDENKSRLNQFDPSTMPNFALTLGNSESTLRCQAGRALIHTWC